MKDFFSADNDLMFPDANLLKVAGRNQQETHLEVTEGRNENCFLAQIRRCCRGLQENIHTRAQGRSVWLWKM